MRIFAVGLDNDKTLMRFVTEALEAGDEVSLINLHDVHREPWRIMIPASEGKSIVYSKGGWQVLDPHASYYSRLVDLAAVLSEPDSGAWRHMLAAFSAFLETVLGRVVNRPGAHAHNAAKPLHEWWLAREGFLVPPAITTSSREAAVRFLEAQGTGIVKSLCGVRANAQAMTADDFAGFETGQGPVHIQKYVPGYDIRAHLVDEEVHVEKIDTVAVDYRSREARTVHTPASLPEALRQSMVAASRKLGLVFTGWDFKVDADGHYWCLEVNPMPGYDVYDRRAAGAISRSIAHYLTGGVSRLGVAAGREETSCRP